jgi:hypothetical protein
MMIEITNAIIAMVHHGKYKQERKLNKIIKMAETINFILKSLMVLLANSFTGSLFVLDTPVQII